MESDHFGIWIHTRSLLKQLKDDELNESSKLLHGILEMFGGWKKLLLFMLNDRTKFSWKQLYQLQKIILESQEYNNNNMKSSSLNLLNINNDCINKIYKYLPRCDHINLSKTCSELLTIGRSNTSFDTSEAAYKLRIIPGLSHCLMNFNKLNGMDDFIKIIKYNNNDDLSPIVYTKIFTDLIEISQIEDDIDIRNPDNYDIEERKHFIFSVIKSFVDNRFSSNRDEIIDKFNMKQIAHEYCFKYCVNNPPKLKNSKNNNNNNGISNNIGDYMQFDDGSPSSELSCPFTESEDEEEKNVDLYYKNAQLAMEICTSLLKWNDDDYSIINKLKQYVRPQKHRMTDSIPVINLGFEDLLHSPQIGPTNNNGLPPNDYICAVSGGSTNNNYALIRDQFEFKMTELITKHKTERRQMLEKYVDVREKLDEVQGDYKQQRKRLRRKLKTIKQLRSKNAELSKKLNGGKACYVIDNKWFNWFDK